MVKGQDTVLDIRPSNGAAPTWKPFVLQQVYRIECCELEGYEDFCIKARVNLTNDERDALAAANDDVLKYSQAWETQSVEEREQEDTPHRRQMALVAPFVVAWNAAAIDQVTGEPKELPAPAEAGPEVFDLIFPDLTTWVRTAVLNGYLSGKGINHFGRAWRLMRERTSAGSDAAPS